MGKRSQQVEQADYIPAEEKPGYSDLQVLESNAGFYIGTTFTDPETGLIEPGSRDSGYFATREAAQRALDADDYTPRLHP